jgi:hypothetical protein
MMFYNLYTLNENAPSIPVFPEEAVLRVPNIR